MKNALKIAILALTVTAFASCSGNKSTSTIDTVKIDSTKTDSTVKVDTAKVSTTTTDSIKN